MPKSNIKLNQKSFEKLLGFSFGVIFILIILGILFTDVTKDDPFKKGIIKALFALSGAGVAVMINGILEVEIPGYIRAGGALAVFVILYFFFPAIEPEKLKQPVIKCTFNDDEIKISPIENVKEVDLIAGLKGESAKYCFGDGGSVIRTEKEIRCKKDVFKSADEIHYKIEMKKKNEKDKDEIISEGICKK